MPTIKDIKDANAKVELSERLKVALNDLRINRVNHFSFTFPSVNFGSADNKRELPNSLSEKLKDIVTTFLLSEIESLEKEAIELISTTNDKH